MCEEYSVIVQAGYDKRFDGPLLNILTNIFAVIIIITMEQSFLEHLTFCQSTNAPSFMETKGFTMSTKAN
jgi:hypothetical protein